MSISLEIMYKDPTKDDVYYPIVSTVTNGSYDMYWKPLVEQNQLVWVELMYSVGLPLLKYLDKIEEILSDFEKLIELTNTSLVVRTDYKNIMINKISIIIETLNEIILNPEKFLEVYLG
ncbi:MAG: hypothetical protein Phog2KO_15610 [Phototrophicaceae bacterium]